MDPDDDIVAVERERSSSRIVEKIHVTGGGSYCFVAMSDSGKSAVEAAFKVLRGTLEEMGVATKRARDSSGDQTIIEDIISLIERADFVVADLSEERPNVYFELGYARGVGKKVVTIAREEATIHFNASNWRCFRYSDSHELPSFLQSVVPSLLEKRGHLLSED